MIMLFVGILYGVRTFTMTLQTFGLPGVAVSGATATPAIQSPDIPTPEPQVPAAALPPAWDGSSRVTILLIGLDYADWTADRTGPSRSDTMMLVTLDPQTKTAGMLSIPRDLWVNIPGFDHARINTAYYQGDANKLPGGGPALAVKTVEQVIGVPVQYFAQVDFMTFVKIIDYIGPLYINVNQKVIIDPIGAGPDDIMIPKGVQRFDGMRALAFARARNTKGGDVDRAVRQQLVMMAVRDKVLDPANFPRLIANAPAMYAEFQSGIKTNMSLDDAIKLAVFLQQIDPANIKRGVINYDMVLLASVTVNGEKQDVFKPIPDKIRELRDDIFTSSGAISPMALQGANAEDINALVELARQENASLAIYNGTYTQGLAQQTAAYFQSLGLNVVGTATASEYPGVTKIIDHRGRPYALRFFKMLFGIGSGSQIISKFDLTAPADIEIILGDDWAANNTMPK